GVGALGGLTNGGKHLDLLPGQIGCDPNALQAVSRGDQLELVEAQMRANRWPAIESREGLPPAMPERAGRELAGLDRVDRARAARPEAEPESDAPGSGARL